MPKYLRILKSFAFIISGKLTSVIDFDELIELSNSDYSRLQKTIK